MGVQVVWVATDCLDVAQKVGSMDLLEVEMFGFHMARHVGFLTKWSIAVGANVRLDTCMPSEVVSNVATLLKYLVAALNLTLVVSLKLLRQGIEKLNRVIPVFGNTFELLLNMGS